jgi:lipid-binding SYLF domain-containing protein
MVSYKKIGFIALFLTMGWSHQVFSFGEAIGDLANKMNSSITENVSLSMTASEIDQDANQALNQLYSRSAAAAHLGKSATAILVFPKILKAGLGVGGQHGTGALQKQGKTVAYYTTFAASYGLQMGVQSFGFALFFMNKESLDVLNNHNGWEVGVGPSIVMVDKGMAKSLTTTTLKEGVYVFTFNQKGLMAGAGIQGSKITKMDPKK